MTQGATLYEPEEGSVERNMLGYETPSTMLTSRCED
jgi:hypothetical protein